MANGFDWQQWLAFATAMLGLLVGGAVTEIHATLAGARERRRALSVLLFDLLQLRLDVRNSDPRNVLATLVRVGERKFGQEAAQVFASAEFRAIVVGMQEQLAGSERPKLTERYENALRALVPHDPVLAYDLSGNERIVHLERAIGLYYGQVAQHPDFAKDAHAPKFLSVMENETTTALIGEVVKDLAVDIRRVARARRPWLLRLLWTPLAVQSALRRQDNMPAAKTEQRLDELIDRVLPQLVRALQTAAASQ